jgi:hypothetical protein
MKYVREQPEKKIRSAIRTMLRGRGWGVEITHGNQYSSGLPDLYVMHHDHGTRWIDAKVEGRYSYTRAQKRLWPQWHFNHRVGIWIMTGADQAQYDRLFQAPNWLDYWKDVWGTPQSYLLEPDIDGILDCIED